MEVRWARFGTGVGIVCAMLWQLSMLVFRDPSHTIWTEQQLLQGGYDPWEDNSEPSVEKDDEWDDQAPIQKQKQKHDGSDIGMDCFPHNSEAWMSGTILSNNGEGVTPQLLEALIEGPRKPGDLPTIFDQTICHEDSPLRKFGAADNILEATEDWYQRFLYLAIHWKFHRPALAEHQARRTCAMATLREQHGIGALDFECPGAKFLVTPISNAGFGGFLTGPGAQGMVMALATGRVPIFASGHHPGDGMDGPWLLSPSSCSRRDLQCYFLPVSPCTITREELDAAPRYGPSEEDKKYSRRHAGLPPKFDDEKVVVVNRVFKVQSSVRPELMQVLAEAIGELLEYHWGSEMAAWSDEQQELVKEAHRWMTEKADADPFGLIRQITTYMLRPNPRYKALVDQTIANLVSSPQGTGGSATIDPSNTIGIAIRGSDKCQKESMCFPFQTYMDLATEVAYPHLDASSHYGNNSSHLQRPNLIMTTEDPNVFRDSLEYQTNGSFPFRLLVNAEDNFQGSGAPQEFFMRKDVSEKTMVSSLVALKFHLYASRVYLNCCSNFHKVLRRLLTGQCGARRHGHDFVVAGDGSSNPAAKPEVAVCLSSPHNDIPSRYRLCCQWSRKEGECVEIWAEYQRKQEDHKQFLETLKSLPRPSRKKRTSRAAFP